jgi:DNA-binding transcriptional LysR family regulator
VEFLPLVEEELVFIAAPELSAQMENGGFGQDRRLIGFGSRCIYQSIARDVLMREWGIPQYKSLEYASLEMMKQTVMNGLGVALVPKVAVEQELQAGRLDLLKLKDKVFVTHGLITWKDKEHTSAVKALKQTVLDKFSILN